jgi:hypothetical protein
MAHPGPVLAGKALADGQRVAIGEQTAHRSGVGVTPAAGEGVDTGLDERDRIRAPGSTASGTSKIAQ